MRSLIISLLIGAGVIFGSVLYTSHLENTSNMMLAINERIEKSISEENYSKANDEIEELRKLMDESKMTMEAVGNHEKFDGIEKALAELKSYASEENRSDAMAKISVLKLLIGNLPNDYKLNIENIL